MQRNETHLNFFDTMRGVALIGVYLAHSRGEAFGWNFDPFHSTSMAEMLTFPIMFGGVAVPIFFAISGFCIHLAHCRSTRKEWFIFFTRRFFRIYPPFLVALLLECILFRGHILATGEIINRGQFFSHLFLIHNFWHDTLFGINGSFWSIAVEAQLYLLYPFVFVMAKRIGWKRTLIITAVIELSLRTWACLCIALHAELPPTFITQSPFGYWFSWTIGAAAAEAFLNGRPLPFARVPVWFFPVATVAMGIAPFLQPFCFVLASLATVVVTDRLLLSPENAPSERLSPVMRYVRHAGTVSYSMYLLHQPFVYAIADRLHRTRIGGEPLLVLLITVAFWFPILYLASLFFRFIEQPSIALGKRFIENYVGKVRSAPR